jgi:hypothetical protein
MISIVDNIRNFVFFTSRTDHCQSLGVIYPSTTSDDGDVFGFELIGILTNKRSKWLTQGCDIGKVGYSSNQTQILFVGWISEHGFDDSSDIGLVTVGVRIS